MTLRCGRPRGRGRWSGAALQPGSPAAAGGSPREGPRPQKPPQKGARGAGTGQPGPPRWRAHLRPRQPLPKPRRSPRPPPPVKPSRCRAAPLGPQALRRAPGAHCPPYPPPAAGCARPASWRGRDRARRRRLCRGRRRVPPPLPAAPSERRRRAARAERRPLAAGGGGRAAQHSEAAWVQLFTVY